MGIYLLFPTLKSVQMFGGKCSRYSEERSLVLGKLLNGRDWQRVSIKRTEVAEGGNMDGETITAREIQSMCAFETPEV